jgi:hypothetical protein
MTSRRYAIKELHLLAIEALRDAEEMQRWAELLREHRVERIRQLPETALWREYRVMRLRRLSWTGGLGVD